MRDGQTFDHIVRTAGGRAWSTTKGRSDPETIASLVLDPDWIVGLRHRSQTRLIVFDIDAHRPLLSPYWHPAGPEASPALQRLLTAAEMVGAASVIFQTPSGGWHVFAVLPEAVPSSEAAWIARVLSARACLEEAPGQLEAFPTPLSFQTGAPRHWKRSNGFRLPGQQGGATWLSGSVGWCSEPETAWLELQAAIEATAPADLPAWQAIRDEAQQARRRAEKRLRSSRFPLAGGRHRGSAVSVAWTGPSQSNGNLGAIANALYRHGEDPESFGSRIAAAARACPGFDRFASDDTKRRLDSWAMDRAKSCIKKPPRGAVSRCSRSTDPGRNARLHREAVCRVISRAAAVVAEHGEEAMRLSERTLAGLLGIARNTLRRLRGLVMARLTAALFRVSPATGSDPSPKVGNADAAPEEPLAVLFKKRTSLHLTQPISPGSDRSPPPDPPPLPTRAAHPANLRRQLEREELARWLAWSSP
jgi:hypothetical protein